MSGLVVWISAWTALYKITKHGGCSPWRSYVWTSLVHSLLVSIFTLPYAVAISSLASAEVVLFAPPPHDWILDASLGYYIFDTFRSLELLLRACSARSGNHPYTRPLMSLSDRAVWLSESSPFLIPTTFPFSFVISVCLVMVIFSNLYRMAAYALLAEELSTVFLRTVQLTPSGHCIQLTASMLFVAFFPTIRVVVGTVLISRSFAIVGYFSWATSGERIVQFCLASVLVISRVVHLLWIMGITLAVAMAADSRKEERDGSEVPDSQQSTTTTAAVPRASSRM